MTLSGRVGTDGERRIAEHVLTDVLGVTDFVNDLLVDPSRRAESPAAIEEHLADEEQRSGALLGDVAVPFSPESEHLATKFQNNLPHPGDYPRMEEGRTRNGNPPTEEGPGDGRVRRRRWGSSTKAG